MLAVVVVRRVVGGVDVVGGLKLWRSSDVVIHGLKCLLAQRVTHLLLR